MTALKERPSLFSEASQSTQMNKPKVVKIAGFKAEASDSVKFKKFKVKQQKKLKDETSDLLSSLTVSEGQASFTAKDHLLSSLLYAVQVSRSTQQTPLPPFLLNEHFKSSVKFSWKGPPHALPSILFRLEEEEEVLEVALSLSNQIKVKEYAPLVFALLRDRLYCFDLQKSLFDSANGPPTKKGSSYESADHQVIIRLLEGQDVDALLVLLKSLHPYLVQVKTSLLPQYLACFRLNYTDNPFYVSCVRNAICSSDTFFPLHELWTLNAEGARQLQGEKRPLQLFLKNQDGLRLQTILESDLKFLSSQLLVNYSLAIGVHSIEQWEHQMALEEEELSSQMARLSTERKDSLSLTIDPAKHPFVVPSSERFVYYIGFEDLLPLKQVDHKEEGVSREYSKQMMTQFNRLLVLD